MLGDAGIVPMPAPFSKAILAVSGKIGDFPGRRAMARPPPGGSHISNCGPLPHIWREPDHRKPTGNGNFHLIKCISTILVLIPKKKFIGIQAMTDPATAAKFAHLAVMLLQSLGQQPAISEQTAAARQIETPASITELGEIALDCHHRTGTFKSIQVLERPWRRGGNYAAVSSVLIQVNWQELFGGPIRTRIGIVARDNKIRTIVQDTESPIPANRSCALNRWVKVTGETPIEPPRAGAAPAADLEQCPGRDQRADQCGVGGRPRRKEGWQRQRGHSVGLHRPARPIPAPGQSRDQIIRDGQNADAVGARNLPLKSRPHPRAASSLPHPIPEDRQKSPGYGCRTARPGCRSRPASR